MMWKRNTRWQLAVWAIVCWYALILSGLPLPVDAFSSSSIAPSGVALERVAAKDRTKPFPCMNKPCGCLSAKQCFQKCCCHTPAETLAWAEQHDLSSEILRALQRRVDQRTHPKQNQNESGQKVQGTCCHTGNLKPNASVTPSTEDVTANDMCGEDICFEYEYLSSAGDKESSSGQSSQHELQDDKHDAGHIEVMSEHSIILKSLLACGGLVSEWFASGLAILPAPVEAVCRGQLLLESPGQCPRLLRGVRSAPPTPPPCLG